MKAFLTTLLTVFLFGTATTAPAQAPSVEQPPTITFDFFYQSLQPYGDWVYVEDYGFCFRPFISNDDPAWAPYVDGSWAYTDAGWTWISNEPFGWACYHYGRWIQVSGYWAWVPGYEWGPGWVSWRWGDDVIGWAPLPPEAVWDQSIGFGGWVDTTYNIGPMCYTFMPVRYFGAPNCRPYLFDRNRNLAILRFTTNITSITWSTAATFTVTGIRCGGPDLDEINRRCEHPIRRLELRSHHVEPTDFLRGGHHATLRDDHGISVFAPRITQPVRNIAPPNVQIRYGRAAIDRGWRHVDSDQALAWKARMIYEDREHPNPIIRARMGVHSEGDSRTQGGGSPPSHRGPESGRTSGPDGRPSKSGGPASGSNPPHGVITLPPHGTTGGSVGGDHRAPSTGSGGSGKGSSPSRGSGSVIHVPPPSIQRGSHQNGPTTVTPITPGRSPSPPPWMKPPASGPTSVPPGTLHRVQPSAPTPKTPFTPHSVPVSPSSHGHRSGGAPTPTQQMNHSPSPPPPAHHITTPVPASLPASKSHPSPPSQGMSQRHPTPPTMKDSPVGRSSPQVMPPKSAPHPSSPSPSLHSKGRSPDSPPMLQSRSSPSKSATGPSPFSSSGSKSHPSKKDDDGDDHRRGERRR